MASTPPDGILLDRHLDVPVARVVWFRRVVVLVVVALLAVALAGKLGQPPRTSTAIAPEAVLSVEAPTALRGGLFFQGKFTIAASAPLEHATLVLDEGWLDQLSINTVEPAPTAEEAATGGWRSTTARSTPESASSCTSSSRSTRRTSAAVRRTSRSLTATG